MSIFAVRIEKPDDLTVIVGQAHFVKSVTGLHNVLAGAGPHPRFGLAFCEASGPRLIRHSGNDQDLVELAIKNAHAVGAGHSFIVFLRDGYPVDVLNAIKQLPEVCTIFCATANPVDLLLAGTAQGRGVIGVVDGSGPLGVETAADQAARADLLHQIGYQH